ncbi:Uncharacterised protein [Enterobacter cloacae]|nr:Uncharacterised protein [Enterobacter cloacae]
MRTIFHLCGRVTFRFLLNAITRAHADSMQRRLKRRNAGLPCSEVWGFGFGRVFACCLKAACAYPVGGGRSGYLEKCTGLIECEAV